MRARMKMKVGTRGLFLIALLVAAVLPSAAAGSVVIGSDLANPPNANGTCGVPCTLLPTVSPSPLTSPVDGAVVSWTTFGGSGTVGTFGNLQLRIIRPAGGGAYTAVRSGPFTSISDVAGHPLITTPVTPGLPISKGDYVGVDLLNGSGPLAMRLGGPAFTTGFWSGPPLADGSSLPPDGTNSREMLYQATIEPTNTFTLGAVTRNKKKGTATLNLTLPNPGELTASGDGVKAASAGGAVISKSVGAGPAQLLIKAKGKKKKKLSTTGKVKLNVTVTYTPTGGDSSTQSVTVKLKKKH